MHNLNDTVLRIHMTFLSNKQTVEWISSFEDEISPLSDKEFQRLIDMLEGVSQSEQANFMESITSHNIPGNLQLRTADASNFLALIEQLKLEYTRWKG